MAPPTTPFSPLFLLFALPFLVSSLPNLPSHHLVSREGGDPAEHIDPPFAEGKCSVLLTQMSTPTVAEKKETLITLTIFDNSKDLIGKIPTTLISPNKPLNVPSKLEAPLIITSNFPSEVQLAMGWAVLKFSLPSQEWDETRQDPAVGLPYCDPPKRVERPSVPHEEPAQGQKLVDNPWEDLTCYFECSYGGGKGKTLSDGSVWNG